MTRSAQIVTRTGLLGSLFLGSLIASYSNVLDEPTAKDSPFWWTLLWAVVPALILVTYVLGSFIVRDPQRGFTLSISLMTMSLLVSWGYAANGSTTGEPETAAHLHLLLVPVLLAMISLIPLSIMWIGIIGTFLGFAKTDRNGGEENNKTTE